MNFYKLVDKKPVRCCLDDYGIWENTNTRNLAYDTIGKINISTVFLGLDYQFGGGPPILFETCIFGRDRHGEITRYCTYEEAIEGHKKIFSSLILGPKARAKWNFEQSEPKKHHDKRNCRRIHLRQ